MTPYQKMLEQLNPAQKQAVETIEGPVMVIAGPGTGKTHVLAARIAHILEKTDTPPHAILALTFTESGAINMRNRVVNLIGKAGYYVNIQTFHAFCSDIIRTHPEYFPIDRGSEALSDLEKYELFQSLMQKTELEVLKPLNMPLFYIRDIMQAISNLKREGVMPDDFKQVIDEEFTPDTFEGLNKTDTKRRESQAIKNRELLIVYEEYQSELRKRLRYDYDDMIALVVEAFKSHELLLREYQEILHYFLVDEYQDTNASQNMVIDLLASYWGDEANICVVGDPNQSIFRFQGASIENTLNFVKTYPTAKVITLDTGYRSTQLLYDTAHAVISENKLTAEEGMHELHKAVSQKLKSGSGVAGEPISIVTLPAQTLELVFIAQEISRLIEAGTPLEEIAVLYRNNSEAGELQHVLEKWGIPYEIEGGENILESEMIRQLLQVMYALRDIKNGAEDEKLFEIMAYDWTDIDPMFAIKLARTAGKNNTSIVDVIEGGYENFLKIYTRGDILQEDFSAGEVFLEQLKKWILLDATEIFTHWFEKFINESGYLSYILVQENRAELVTNLNSFFREIKALIADNKGMKLDEFLTAISTMQEHRMSIYAEDVNVEKGVVHLTTAHKAKGREWTHVFIMHCVDGMWGNTRKREMIPLPAGLLKSTDISKKERNEDDRRLFYVALTRAKRKVYITSSTSVVSQHRSRSVTHSMFLEEIPLSNRLQENTDVITEEAHEHLVTLLEPSRKKFTEITDRAFFQELVDNFKLSVTALNTYLRDPHEFMLNSILKVPRAKAPFFAFGTAIHFALEQLNKALAAGEKIDARKVLKDFDTALERELLTDSEFERRREYGRSVLKGYIDQYNETLTKPVFIEKMIGYGFSKAMLGDISLTGRLDRVEWIDEKLKAVRIVDYKTGSPKTVGDIEGKTVAVPLSEREQGLPESVRGPYKRQLLFYKLLADLDQTFPYTVEEGLFDFVEPDKQTGKRLQRLFVLKQEDVNDLKKLIQEVMAEIRTLKFLEN